MKKVSIIILAYRSAETITETLESIKKQDYGKIELIVSDDCSPDNTVEIARKWIEQQAISDTFDIKLITTKTNTGIPGNINRALKETTGEYVKILAADDLLATDAISAYVSFMETHPNTMPIAKVKLFCTENPGLSFPVVETYCQKCYEFAQKEYQEQYQMLLMQNCIVAPSASFYPTELLLSLGGYEESYRWFEDYPMNLKIMHEGIGFGFLDKEIVYYRMSASSITASSQTKLKKAELALFRKQRFWYMVQAGMGLEALKQCKYWIKIALQK